MKTGKLAKQTIGILLFGIILTAIVFKNTWSRENTRWGQELEQEILEDSLILASELEMIRQEVQGIVSLYNSSKIVSRNGFSIYVSPLLENRKFIKAFQWVPRIRHSDRSEFERRIRSEGMADFQITEAPETGSPVQASERAEYFPILYMEPFTGESPALGFDLGHDPQFFQVLQESRDSRKPMAISKYGFIPNADSEKDLLIVAPIYSHEIAPVGIEERRNELAGYVVGVYRIKEMLNQMVNPYLAKGMNLVVYGGDEAIENNRLFGERAKDSSREINTIVNIFNQRWFLAWQGTHVFRDGPQPMNSIWISSGVLGITVLLCIIFQIMASRTRQVESEVRTQTEKLTQANKKLLDLNDLKNKFLGMASHDLRNPLSNISGYSKFLIDRDKNLDDGTRLDFLKRIQTISNNMVGLLNNLLDISVIESGQLNLEPKLDSLKNLLQERVHIQHFFAQKKDITLHFESSDLPDFAFDANRIGQVIDNLISNAIKYSPKGKSIHIRLEAHGQSAKVSVQDQGPGIPEEDRVKLFQHFQKLSARPTGGESSSGLGLAIAHKIIEEHQGTIGVENAHDSGAIFSFEVPLALKKIGSTKEKQVERP